jgi:ketosteroid isomerase-like protein
MAGRDDYQHPAPFDVPDDALTAVWVRPRSSLGARLVAAERVAFPEAGELFDDARDDFVMLAVAGDRRVLHLMRLSVPAFDPTVDLPFLVEDVIGSNQGLSRAEVVDFYADRGVDVAATLSVETNVRFAGGDADVGGMRSADAAYLACFDLLDRLGGQAVFAHLNAPARSSFARVGIPYGVLCGRDELRTPDGAGGFDDTYQPTAIERSEAGPVFEALRPVMPPSRWDGTPPERW